MAESEELAWRRRKDEATKNRVMAALARTYGDLGGLCDDAPFLATLNERTREVIEMRVRHGFTLEETARVIGVTRERVRQIEHKTIRKYRERSAAD
jgi:hypothetical protein